jgi:hypothetical protein
MSRALIAGLKRRRRITPARLKGVRSEYSWTNVADRFIDAYRETLAA